MLEDAGITITEDSVELKPKYESGVTRARDATEKKNSSGLVKETCW